MINRINYLYYDDTIDTAITIKDSLEDTDNLFITVRDVESWKEIVQYLLGNELEFDGLILDWKLDGEDTSNADFSSEALAEQCRRLVSHKLKKKKFSKDFPIILCSAQPGFHNAHSSDTTSLDLFDLILEKDKLAEKGSFLKELASCYQLLENLKRNGQRSVNSILGLDSSQEKDISQDLVKKVTSIKDRDSHEIVRFVKNEVINKKGALIDEAVLAARLGVDIESPKWDELKNKLSSCKYMGTLYNYYNRWWADLVDIWWETNFEDSTLRYLEATERIEKLKTKYPEFSEGLNKISLSEGSIEEDFWTVCYGLQVPLSESDGFEVDMHLHYSWQEKEYICLEEAKNEDNKEKWKKLQEFEEDRLSKYYEDSE